MSWLEKHINIMGIPFHGSLTYDFAKGIAYDNIYPSVSKIANEFVKIRPYAIDANGKPLEKVPLLDKIYHPNQQMSSTDFREALAIGTLTHRKVYLLVWHYEKGELVAGGNGITADNIGGFRSSKAVKSVPSMVISSTKPQTSNTSSMSMT